MGSLNTRNPMNEENLSSDNYHPFSSAMSVNYVSYCVKMGYSLAIDDVMLQVEIITLSSDYYQRNHHVD